jgi:asparagine synthase (glutamine-hydrolysing)
LSYRLDRRQLHSQDESVYARQVAQRFGAEAAERQVAAEDVSYIDQLSATFDEPFADASALPMLPLAQMAREKVTVALSGDGADEIFAGYRRHRFQVAEESLRQLLPDTLRRTVLAVSAPFTQRRTGPPAWFAPSERFRRSA